MSGYYKMERGWMDHPAFGKKKPLSDREAWVWLTEHAQWKDTEFVSNGHAIVVQRGQIAASYDQLAREWGWTKAKVARYATRFRKWSLIDTHTDTGRSVITLCNYDASQDRPKTTDTAPDTAPDTRTLQEPDTKESLTNNYAGKPPAASLRQEAFRRAKALLVGTLDERGKQITAERAGALVNGWLRDYGEAAVIQAVTKAEAAGAAFDGIAYMIGILKHTTGQRSFLRSAPQASPKALVVGSPEWTERQRERGLPVSQGNAA